MNPKQNLGRLPVPILVAMPFLSLLGCQGGSDPLFGTSLEVEGKALTTIPVMTGPNTPAPLVATASGINSSSTPAWSLFDGKLKDSDPHWISDTLPASVQLDIGAAKKIVGYTLVGRYDTLTNRLPSAWKLEGSNNASLGASATWVAVDQRSGVGLNSAGWYASACCEAKLTYNVAPAQYSSYRLTVTAVNGSTVADLLELQFIESDSASTATDPVPGDIVVTMEMPKTQLLSQDGVLVTFKVTNRSTGSRRVEYWKLPTQAIEENILSVLLAGSPVPYIGPAAKRRPPQAEDYIVLAPGQVLTATLDISLSYDVTAVGQYTVDYVGLPLLPATKQAPVPFSILQLRTLPTSTLKSASGVCTTDQVLMLIKALSDAKTIANEANKALAAAPVMSRSSSATRYLRWFGSYDSSRYTTVMDHFDAITQALPNIAFACDCDDKDKYAYVYARKAHTIHLCGAFWSAPGLGTDSKAGTIVHETSHFKDVAETKDHVYGQSDARSLATSDPGKAITNADSHEYFAENTPAFSMPACTTPCPFGSYDGKNCFVGNAPTSAFVSGGQLYYSAVYWPTCPDGSYFDGSNCQVAKAPDGSSAFVSSGHLYYTPVKTPYCPQDGSWYDGANCEMPDTPAFTSAFSYNGNAYYHYVPWGARCPMPSSWDDGAHCQVARPAGTSTFIYNRNIYYSLMYQLSCPVAKSWYDGANCQMPDVPAGGTAFINAGVYMYYTPVKAPTCSMATSWYDGAHCEMPNVPEGTSAFVLNGMSMYYSPVCRNL
jgi:peptidyl-Lys metalloendopeptidase